MTTIRRYGALLALILTLVLAACSSPENFDKPLGLEPQFGSADTDDGLDVATLSTGRIYSLSMQNGPIYEEYEDGTSEEVGEYRKVFLRRYDSSGQLAWTKIVDSEECHDYYTEFCDYLSASALRADTQGNVYYKVASSLGDTACSNYLVSRIYKYDATGRFVRTSAWFYNGESWSDGADTGPAFAPTLDFAVDGSGNVYAVGQQGEADDDLCSFDRQNVVSKYSVGGALQWQRTSTVGTPYGVAVSPSGNIYVTGSKGIARYTSSGNLTWSKAVGSAEQIMVTGSYLYTRALNTLRKYDANGKLLWSKAQSGLSGLITQDMTSDSSGNLYLSGKYNASSTNRNAFTRKLNSSGSVLWTKTFGTTTFDDAKGIATISGSELYVTGLTKGSLSHTNIGGDDGYIRKLNSSGNLVWTK